MTLLELAVALLACMTVAFPKPVKRTKKRRRIRRKGKFHACDNPLKTYKEIPRETLEGWACERARKQLAARWPAEEAFAAMLTDLGVRFERQVPFFLPARFILVDFLVRLPPVVFEVDGRSHEESHENDVGRDRWLEDVHGYRVCRIPNWKVFKEPDYVRRYVKRALWL